MSDPVTAGELTWPEFERRVQNAPVFVPVGSTEQHGPHLPLDTDTVIPNELAIRIARRADGVVMPPVAYGRRSQTESGGGPTFPGTVDLRGRTLETLLVDVFEELQADGAREIIVLNGHGENQPFIEEAIDACVDDSGAKFLSATWTAYLSEGVRDAMFEDVDGGFPGWNAEHAGVAETSLMLHFKPEVVDLDAVDGVTSPRSAPYRSKPVPEEMIPENGLFFDPTEVASPEFGERIVEDVVSNALDAIEREWA